MTLPIIGEREHNTEHTEQIGVMWPGISLPVASQDKEHSNGENVSWSLMAY